MGFKCFSSCVNTTEYSQYVVMVVLIVYHSIAKHPQIFYYKIDLNQVEDILFTLGFYVTNLSV